GHERDPRPANRPLPQTAVEEELARVVVVVARPLKPAVLLETRVAHARVHRREPAHLVPDRLGVRPAPVATHAFRQIEETRAIVASARGPLGRLSQVLHPTPALRHGRPGPALR